MPRVRGQEVRVVDFDMPFGSMVALMIKWAFASIPAMIVIFFACPALLAMLGGCALN